MDADRFDTLARALSAPRSRRAALSSAAAGGLLSALGLTRAVPETRAAQGGLCVVAFTATTGRIGEVRGTLSFSLAGSGNLDNAALTLPDGAQLPVVGQATGHSLQLRIALGPQQALVAVGVGEQEISRCQGAIDGVATGSQSGDLGDWHATAGVQNVPSGGQGGNTQAQGGAATSGTRTDRSGSTGAAASGTRAAASGSAAGSGASSTSSGGIQNCAPPFAVCGNACVNLQTDALNCGQCGTMCPVNNCSGGVCGGGGIQNCAPPFAVCNGACVDTSTDQDNCGTCGNVCPVSPEIYNCEGGVCVPPSCAPLTNCGGLCDDLLISSLNCGTCGTVCGEGTTCQGGACIVAGGGGCKDGSLTFCSGVCVNVQTDPAHCGGCDLQCVAGTTCQGGECVAIDGAGAPPAPDGQLQTCDAQGLMECAGVCVDITTDNANCGGCGAACGEGTVCQVGGCVGTIP